MYPVSNAFLDAVKANNRKYYWTGRITTTAGTVYEFDQDDMVKGSGYITGQCCGSTEIELGTVYAAEMGISLFSEINRYTLDDAKMELFYHLQVAGGSYESVPMGIFEVSEVNRKAKCLEIKAYDYMVRFEKAFTSLESIGNAYDFMVLCSTACEVTLAQDRATIEEMPNGTENLSIYSDNDIETYRDVLITITADFRKYPCIEKSIADHSAYLLGAKNGSKLRYEGLKGCTDYKKAVQIIKDGGYATSLTYVEKLISIIERWNLTQYEVKDSGGEVIRWYRVRKSWADAKSQKGAYKILDNAKKCADQNPGYKVFDADGKVVYEPKAADSAVNVPFLVKVSISDLNIRKGPGTDYHRVQFIPIGVYTIMEVRSGKGSSAGWGRLKSGIGWISLDFVRRI